GVGKVGTRLLRRDGIDVLAYGNARETVGALDSTRIVVRRGTEEVGRRVRRALGLGRVVLQLDSARLLDASVLLGADFAPRLEFHPLLPAGGADIEPAAATQHRLHPLPPEPPLRRRRVQ